MSSASSDRADKRKLASSPARAASGDRDSDGASRKKARPSSSTSASAGDKRQAVSGQIDDSVSSKRRRQVNDDGDGDGDVERDRKHKSKKSKKSKKHKKGKKHKHAKDKKSKSKRRASSSSSSSSSGSDSEDAGAPDTPTPPPRAKPAGPREFGNLELTDRKMAKNAVRTLIQTHGWSDASLQPELILLFSGLDDGESVCIDNIANKDIRSYLNLVFERSALTPVTVTGKRGTRAVYYQRSADTPNLIAMFEDCFSFTPQAAEPAIESLEAPHDQSPAAAVAPQSDEAAVSTVSDAPPRARAARVMGPAIPEDTDLARAAAEAAAAPRVPAPDDPDYVAPAGGQPEAEPDLDYDDFGPKTTGTMTQAEQYALDALRAARAQAAAARAEAEAQTGGREEWMTALPKEFSLAASLGASNAQKGRTFNIRDKGGEGRTEASAGAWTDAPAERHRKEQEKLVQDYLERAAREASQARKRGKGADSGGAGDEARARAEDMRSRQQQLKHTEASSASSSAPSLLDIHSQKQDEEHKAAAAKGSSLVDKHIMWDREKEMSMRRQMSDKDKNKLVAEAQKLTSRFDMSSL